MSAVKRQHAGAAVSGLFARPTATGGLAGRPDPPAGQPSSTPAAVEPLGASGERVRRRGGRQRAASEPRVRLGVELTESEVAFLRGLSRPGRTGQPRTLGAKLVATGVLAAAIELLREADVDIYGVRAGDLAEMTARARAALLRAGSGDDASKEQP